MANDTDDIRALDWTLLLVFRELLRSRRARDAAQALDVSPAAVSHALSRLRLIFDDELFIRRSRGFEPTPRALALRPSLEAVIEAAADLISAAPVFDAASSTRRFAFSAPDFVAAAIAAPLLDALAAAAPGVQMRLMSLPEAEAAAGVLGGSLDFALGRFVCAAAPLHRESFYADQTCVIARAGHPDAPGALAARGWTQLESVFQPPFADAAAPFLLQVLVVSLTDRLASCPRRTAERLAQVLPIQLLPAPRPARVPVFVVRREAADPGVDWFLDQVREATAGAALRFGQAE